MLCLGAFAFAGTYCRDTLLGVVTALPLPMVYGPWQPLLCFGTWKRCVAGHLAHGVSQGDEAVKCNTVRDLHSRC